MIKHDASSSRMVTACPSEDEVLAFAAGRLSPERRKAAHLHFDACEVCQALLNEAVHALAVAPTVHSVNDGVAWGTQFRPGTIVGQRYVIRHFVARGGMGEVYEAFDRELQERVALKTVTATACDSPTAVRRLKAEVQLARRVSHPNVCRIYDFGTHVVSATAPPTCFLTMEFVDGQTLGERVRKGGALPVGQACALARELLLGLRAAHDAGVLHRDFKSDNVILRGDAERPSPLILDFGLARALDREGEPHSSTHHGVVGTFAYIAPEQLDGEPHSTASDIYSFGVVWFEMLTGELPFNLRSSPARTTLVRLTRAAPLPSRKNPQITRELDELVLGCLRRSPDERFQTPDDVLTRLDELTSRRRPRRWRDVAQFCAAAGLAAGTAYLALAHLASSPQADSKAPPAWAPRAGAAVPPPPLAVVAATPAPATPVTGPSAQRDRAPQPSLSAPKVTRRAVLTESAATRAPSSTPLLETASASPPEAPPPLELQTGWEDPFAHRER
jgi:tRNA A-37 threonylcarbamoyl transferase component Bud32